MNVCLLRRSFMASGVRVLSTEGRLLALENPLSVEPLSTPYCSNLHSLVGPEDQHWLTAYESTESYTLQDHPNLSGRRI